MLNRFALLLMLCALIVPRAAWGAHLAGHGDLAVAGAVHSHVGDQVHEHDGDAAAEALAQVPGGDNGLTHEHSPSFALTVAVLVPDMAGVDVGAWLARAVPVVRDVGFDVLGRPVSILRPPRLA